MPTPSAARHTADAEIADALGGTPRAPLDPDAFVETALRHRMAPLLMETGAARLLPVPAAAALRAETMRHAAFALANDRECRYALDLLAAADVPVLVIKGAHLANTCYRESFLRPRLDTDLVVDERDLATARRALAAGGYRCPPVQTSGEVLGQMVLARDAGHGAAIDLHWRLIAPRVGDRLFAFADLRRLAVPVPRLGPHAMAPCAADALALACVHQVAHHHDDRLLAWMYDIRMLIGSFAASDEASFADSAIHRQIARVCASAIGEAARWMPSPRADRLVAALAAVTQDEPSARLLGAGRSRAGDLLADLRELHGWRARARLLGAHLFPPAAYMRQTYARGRQSALPLLYASRLAAGSWKWIRERTTED
jgi:hypothetical protein